MSQETLEISREASLSKSSKDGPFSGYGSFGGRIISSIVLRKPDIDLGDPMTVSSGAAQGI